MTMTNGSTSRLSRIVTASLVLVMFGLALAYREPLGAWFSGRALHPNESTQTRELHASPEPPKSSSALPGDIDHYTCSMHPSVNQPGPGKCPICGMDLIPVTKLQQTEGVVTIDEGRRQLIGVRTAPVIEGPMNRTFRAVGRVTYDESAFTDVNLKVSGWITKLFVNQTGQRVTRGQPLFTLYSPELYNAQQDFLLATHAARGGSTTDGSASRVDQLARAAKKRLSLLGLSDSQIDEIASAGAPLDTISITAPATGFVIEKDVVEGASVQAATRLFRIAALDQVWVEAEVYEEDLAHVRVGQRAKVTLDYLPGQTYDAKVSYVYPYMESAARTGRVRVELANKQRDLRPGMYASVELAADLGRRVQVPASAVVYTGPRRLVFVDLGEGRFKPQEVHVGTEANGMYEVLDGLAPGDMIATSGMFLIAAEARISTAAKYWNDDPPTSAPDSAGTREHGSEHHAEPALHDHMPSRARPDRHPLPHDVANPMDVHSMPHDVPTPTDVHPTSAGPTSAAAPSVIYTCPMHPEVQSNTPGKCPKCGMQLVPVPHGKTP
jgi:RND family efflux transporter MFP subunit